MLKKLMNKATMIVLGVLLFCSMGMNSHAAQMEEASSDLSFEIAIFTYEILPEASQDDMPAGFIIGDWEYHGVPVKAGFTENSDMVCVMGEDQETGYEYRFIYDPEHELFVPYFGTEVKDGYIYTIPMYEGAEVPYGFMESYFVIQTVPMFTYMRTDAELTQEEIAVGSLSEDNYLVFLMMDENGREVHYTYDLIDRTFQRSLLQEKDAEKVAELNEVIDKLHEEIGILNANHAERMNGRLTLIGILAAAAVIMIGVIINLLLKISKLKNDEDEAEEEYDEYEDDEVDEDDDDSVTEEMQEEAEDELEILDLDLEDE